MNQEYLSAVLSNINLLATLAKDLEIPVILTQQYPQGLAPTIGPIKKILAGKNLDTFNKTAFGCCDESGFDLKLKKTGRRKIILTGMETHVCVYLTALGLLGRNFTPFVVADAVISRKKFHYKNGLNLLRQAGAVLTNTETLLFQLMQRSGSETFKKISGMLKEKS